MENASKSSFGSSCRGDSDCSTGLICKSAPEICSTPLKISLKKYCDCSMGYYYKSANLCGKLIS